MRWHETSVILLLEFKRGSILWERKQIHVKEIYSKFTVEIMKLVFVFIFSRKVFRKLFQIMFEVGTISMDALVNSKMLAILYWRKGMTAIRAD
jgi:hypothetical protein